MAARQNADQIADVHQGGAGAGKGQVLAGGGVLLEGFDGKNAVNGGNHNGNANVAVQEKTVHVAENLLCVIKQIMIEKLYSADGKIQEPALKKQGKNQSRRVCLRW